jgi:multidrug efflux pump subunit AcrA (membrane-fusion protein)
MKRLAVVAIAILVMAGAGWLVWQRLAGAPPPGTLYGNVEIRQVDLSFNAEGTVIAMPKQEGDRVKQGETIAELDPATYQSAYDLAMARRDSAQAQLDVLLAGTRQEQIDQRVPMWLPRRPRLPTPRRRSSGRRAWHWPMPPPGSCSTMPGWRWRVGGPGSTSCRRRWPRR